MVVTSSQGKGGKESTGGRKPGNADDALNVVVHEKEQRQQGHPVADRSDHHPSVAMGRTFFERAPVDGQDEENRWDEHVAHYVELLAAGALADDL